MLEELKKTKAWDDRYNLPLCPEFNNPWIYMAYAQLLLSCHGESLDLNAVRDYYQKCRVEPGLFNRWPGGFGGRTSHDEVIGACYLSRDIAREVFRHLSMTNGDYNNTGEKENIIGEHNLYRFVWLRPYISKCGGYEIGTLSKIIFAAHVVVDSFQTGDAGGKLKTYLMLEKMRYYSLIKKVDELWLYRMKKYSFRLALAKEVPVLSQFAPLEGWP